MKISEMKNAMSRKKTSFYELNNRLYFKNICCGEGGGSH